MKTLKWIESEGGPLLVLSKEYLSLWEGIAPPREGA
jgi:hypothetical protein